MSSIVNISLDTHAVKMERMLATESQHGHKIHNRVWTHRLADTNNSSGRQGQLYDLVGWQ
jgi:hypothetical protein